MGRRRRDMSLSRSIDYTGLRAREVCMVVGRSGLRGVLIIVSHEIAYYEGHRRTDD